jgi:small subunit ribosomal protein S2
VAILDSNSSPDGIAYPIPGNDDAMRAIQLYCDLVSSAVLDGLQAELAASGVDIGARAEVRDVTLPEDLPEESRGEPEDLPEASRAEPEDLPEASRAEPEDLPEESRGEVDAEMALDNALPSEAETAAVGNA